MVSGTIVFNSHIDWSWIKQRPQFIAEGLSDYYDVHVLYRKQYHKDTLSTINDSRTILHPYYTLPALGDRFWFLTRTNLITKRKRLAALLQSTQAEMLWINHPVQVYEIPKWYHGIIIYDCMDDQFNLECPPVWERKISDAEAKLIEKADIVFASSSYLQSLLKERYPEQSSCIYLVRNACSVDFASRPFVLYDHNPGKVVAGYIGTIASWFDFEKVMISLERFPNLHYQLIGPVKHPNPPQHPRLHYEGPVPHDQLESFIKDISFLVMPFVLNQIVRAVDPVKIYEYISFGRNIISVDYEEVHRFRDFLTLYSDTDSYCTAIGKLLNNHSLLFTQKEAFDFLQQNTWDKRVEKIIMILKEINHGYSGYVYL